MLLFFVSVVWQVFKFVVWDPCVCFFWCSACTFYLYMILRDFLAPLLCFSLRFWMSQQKYWVTFCGCVYVLCFDRWCKWWFHRFWVCFFLLVCTSFLSTYELQWVRFVPLLFCVFWSVLPIFSLFNTDAVICCLFLCYENPIWRLLSS